MSPDPTPAPDAVLAALATAERFVVQQVFRPLVNEYRISIPAPGDGEDGEPLLVVKQKRMKIKEDIRFRLDDGDGPHLFAIASKTIFEFRGHHDVLDASGRVIGTLQKDFTRSLVRSQWRLRDAEGTELLEAHEASWLIALVRRIGDVGPDVLGLLQLLPFNFTLRTDGEEVARYRRVLGTLRDRYVMELEPAAAGIDRRLLVAFAVALDALQDR